MNTNSSDNRSPHDASPDRDALRDAFRDGSLTPAQRAAFEAELQRDAQFADDIAAESRWLDALRDAPDDAADDTPDQAAFTADVLARWDRRRKPLIRRSTIVLWAGSAAAAAVIAIVISVVFTRSSVPQPPQQVVDLAPLPENVYINPTRETYAALGMGTDENITDPVGVMLDEVHASFTTRPAELLQKLSSRLTSIELDRLPELAPMTVPDPADWLNQNGNHSETSDTHQAPA